MKKFFCAIIVTLYTMHIYSLEERPPKRLKTSFHEKGIQVLNLRSKDGFVVPLSTIAAQLSPYLTNFLQENVAEIDFSPFNIDTKTLEYYSHILKNVAAGLQMQKNNKEFPAAYLLQRRDGKIIPVTVLPLIKKAIGNISDITLKSLIKLASFTSVEFLLNALCDIFIERYYAEKTFNDFLKDKDALIAEYGEHAFALMQKHAYLTKEIYWGPSYQPYEMSIGDFITLYPNTNQVIEGKFYLQRDLSAADPDAPEAFEERNISSLEGIHLLNWDQIREFEFAFDKLMNQDIDPNFPHQPFKHAINLNSLQLYATNLKSLPADFLFGIRRLQKLDLRRNALKTLPAHFFDPVKNSIEEIDLSDNYIEELDENIFLASSKNNLETVDLSDNIIDFPSFKQEFNLELNKKREKPEIQHEISDKYKEELVNRKYKPTTKNIDLKALLQEIGTDYSDLDINESEEE